MSKFNSIYLSPIAVAITAIFGVAACDDAGEESVSASTIVMTQGALTLTGNPLTSANGTYGAGCTNRSSGNWSVGIGGPPIDIAGEVATGNAVLNVVKNNDGCVLTLTHLRTGASLYLATPVIGPIGLEYLGTSSSFALTTDLETIVFYGNAKLSAVTFAGDFVIAILYSDDPNLDIGSNTANFTVQLATATATGVPAPDYAINMGSLEVSTDEGDIVQTATGNAMLTAGATPGQRYVVLETDPGPDYADVDAAFKAASTTAITGTPINIPATSFTLVILEPFSGEDLSPNDVKRYIIIANTVSDVPSYQVFTITFHPPIRS